MLSVRRRQEDARGVGLRGGAAGGGMEDDAELEEGEAYGDDTAFVDPDVALSYIDEKIQDVLGHFQKDFEGAVSAENLGSKFGGYGSFLPTYQRSPLLQTRSPPKAANISSRSPCHQPAESMSQNTLAVAVPSVSKPNGSVVLLSDDSSKKEVQQSTKVERASSTHDSLNGPTKSSDHNRFKVRIKVGSDNGVARNNAAIYSGLGLDISSPSSVEDSPDGCGGLSPEFNNVPTESPRTILQIMTCFSVPGGFLLSPLQGNLLQLTQKVVPTSKKWETSVNIGNVHEGHAAKRVKSDSKKKKAVDTKRSKSRNDISAVMKNEIDIETPAGQKIVSEALNISLLSNPTTMEAKDGSQFEEYHIRNNLVGNKDARLKERTINSDLMAIKPENVKAEAAECLENSGLGSSEMDISASKGETKLKAEKEEAHVEDRNTTSEKDFQLDRKQERKIKTESKCSTTGVNFEGNKVMNEKTPAVGRSTGKVSSKETLVNDINGENVSKSEVRRIQKEQNMNASSSSDFLEDDRGVLSSAAVKEWKNDSQSKSSHAGKKPKAKSHRDVRESLPEGSYGGKDHDTLENGSGLGELRPKEKIWKNDSERDSDMPGTSKREISSSLKNDRHPPTEEQKIHVPPSASAPTANAAPTLPAPVVIDEHWVCCDICQKWRLLPYEMNPALLPKKWKCSMQQWLPGMNRCEVSEDETTNALNALYVIPAPGNGVAAAGHPHVASSGLTTSNTLSLNGHVEQSRKRKNALNDGNGSFEGSQLTQASVHPLSNQHAPTRSKNTADNSQFPAERDSKSVDHFIEKKRSKSKNHGSSSDGGHLGERSRKHSKVKSRREMDHDEYRTSKKLKKEERRHCGIDSTPACDLASGDVPDEAKALPAKSMALQGSSERSDVPSSKYKSVSKYSSSEKSKRAKDGDVFLPEDKNKEHFCPSDVQKSDLSSKKRIVKEWEESQHNSTAQVRVSIVNQSSSAKETFKDQNLKETKSKLTKSEEPFAMADSKSIKFAHSNQTSTYNGGNLTHELFEDSTRFAVKRGMSELPENRSCEQSLDLAEPASNDLAYFQTAAVTSNSSKASGSQRRKQNFQVAKTSIESVSSSPPGISNNDKVSHNKILGKDGSMCANTNNTPSSVKYPNAEVIVDNVHQAKKSHESMLASEPVMNDFLQGNSDKDNDLSQLTQGHASNGIISGRSLDDDLQHASGRKDSSLKGSNSGRGHNHLHSANKNNLLTDGSSIQNKMTNLDTKSDSVVHENKRSVSSLQDRNESTHYPPDGNPQSEVSLGKEKSHPKGNKHDQNSKAQMLPSPLKESKVESHSAPVRSNASKPTAQLRRASVENGGQHGITKQAISNPADTSSPVRKDNNSTGYALKEARDLKHKANRLKEEGKEQESTRLYFESALKYLHVASTLEPPPSIDGFKQCDAAQNLYSDTAKLCNFVGHAYEKSRKMAAAALAYKCVEVAYLKAAYYKYPTASKDRQMLQAIVQAPPGESPSSSASDIDNLNNNGLSKGPSNKDANSPQVTGNNLLLAARNQSHLMRLLAYTNDVNCAFDATRKSQMAIAAAAGNQDNGIDGLSSVKTVLDFNFQSVNDLLRLVRLSMESISC
ncbi:cysteine-tryptophan domain-containing zinc finger protein 7 [Oryza brachyantha]|uniref:CW-type domain-containing protein n=1 Tax=Oryza brachyantha TaxID=4533 RepID=J3MNY5_ORYBR|nr:cysteine-tryptophan domain-containing zinc finger protein 7 [Oryza brachyantha]